MRYLKLRAIWKIVGWLDDIYAHRFKRHRGVTLLKNIIYLADDVADNLLDIIRPADISGKIPVIINVHGGGWVHGSKEGIYERYGVNLARAGFAVLNINYRLAPQAHLREQLADVFAVLDFTVNRADEFGLDTERIFIVGDSAGAYLTGMVACILTNPLYAQRFNLTTSAKVLGIGLNCGVYDFDTFQGADVVAPERKTTLHALFGDDYSEICREASVLGGITTEFLPAYVLSSEMDFLYSETKRLIAALKEHQIKFQSRIYRKRHLLLHVFHLKETHRESLEATAEMLEFFRGL